MRLFALILLCAVLTTSLAEPEPKKYNVQQKKNKSSNTTLSEEERKFLREVEEKFGIKSDVKEENKTDDKGVKDPEQKKEEENLKLPFPAVIAIEIVNDTDTKSKGKRTIDANLGYGYKTNSGYSYSYFGKPVEDKGKFMIYPYSQDDIVPQRGHGSTSGHSSTTQVEIQPSKAFELVSVKEENEGYHYPKPATNYNNVQGLVSPPPTYTQAQHSHGSTSSFIPSTLYTTYNGHGFSGLSGQFPTVMPNYFVDPSQLLKNPEYQNVGLTNDHLRLPGSQTPDQRVVPVLVLRVPSSSLKNPTAELFANVPSNYPLSRYLNNVNLQELVNQYFKKIGYSFAPQLMTYQNSIHSSEETPSENTMRNYGRQHYATPYVQPSYTQSDHSGVQYSAVQPVMAKYPSVYPQRYTLSHGHSVYQQPMHQQKYEYRYQYMPQKAAALQTYYVQSQYQQQAHEAPASIPETNVHSTSAEVQYETSPQLDSHDTGAYEYRTPQIQESQETPKAEYDYRSSHAQDSAEAAKAAYEYSQEAAKAAYEQIQHEHVETSSPSYEHLGSSVADQEYYSQHGQQKETVALYPSQASYDEQSHSNEDLAQNYQYQQESSEETDDNGLVLSENYPSKDHTIATVLPVSYGSNSQNTGAVQTVSYVTPMPHSSKYQSPYRIMVPQTFLTNPSTEKVAYVNSQSVSAYTQSDHQEYNPEAEYTVGPHYIPPISKQKPPYYPRNYHSHPKRMVKPDTKTDSTTTQRKYERNESKKMS